MTDAPKPIAFPKRLRMAQQGDEDRLFTLFAVAHAENGFGDIDHEHVRTIIARACVGDNCIIALIDGPERIEAAIGLHPEKRWYSTNDPRNFYHSDLLIYVHPLHRRTRHAMKLFQFAQWWAQETDIPVVLGLMPRDNFKGKQALFGRFGRHIGALYSIGQTDGWPQRVGTG